MDTVTMMTIIAGHRLLHVCSFDGSRVWYACLSSIRWKCRTAAEGREIPGAESLTWDTHSSADEKELVVASS
jgi:hypothetical protein